MAPVFLAVDEEIDEEPKVIEFDDWTELNHDDAASEHSSDVDEDDEIISILENTTVTETLNEAPINAKWSRLENVIGKITKNDKL